MAAHFFQQQLDYIFFLYGFAFILLAAVCLMMRLEKTGLLPWSWLGLFGLTHGIHEWLEMLTLSLGDGTVFSAVRLGLMAVSLIFLFEFGRDGLLKLQGKCPGRWIYIPLLALATSGSFAGLAGLNAAFRYTFGLSGGVLSTLTLLRASQRENRARHRLFFAAVFMAGYALTAGGIVPLSAFFPASEINQESFLSLTDIPIQLVRGILVFFITTALWWYYQRYGQFILPEVIRKTKTRYGLQFALLIIIVLFFGGILTEYVGKDAEQEIRNDIKNQTKVAAASLDPERVSRLTGAVFNSTHPDYIRLHKQLKDMTQGNPQFRWLYLMSLNEGKVHFVLGSSPKKGYGLSLRSKRIYEQPPVELLKAFTSGQTVVAGPYIDEYGTFLSGFAQVQNPSATNNIAVLGIDINAGYLQKSIAKHRVPPILVTLLISLLCTGFFVVRQRLWESVQLLAVSEKILTEAQKIAHLGSWTYDTQKDILTWSEEMFNIFGLASQESVPSFSAQQQFVHEEDRGKLEETLQKAKREGQGSELEFRVLRPDGGLRFVVLKVNTIIGDNGVHMLGTCQDITEQKLTEEHLRDLSLIDELTGLNNRRGFLILATQEIKLADRLKQRAVLIFADMDELKWVNDTFGHMEGDRALVDIANIIKSALRASDIISRWGGDEFVGLTLESAEKAGEVIMARLQESVEAHNMRGDRPFKLSISFGLTLYDPEKPCALEELLERGDKLMYEQKQKRKMQQMQ